MVKTFVISLGGSIINPRQGVLDEEFIGEFKKVIDGYIRKGHRFVILCGGGKNAREYQRVAGRYGADSHDLDWIGIMATRINAELIRTIFKVRQKVIYDPTVDVSFGSDKVLVAAGWKPGWSTDYDAVRIAVNIGTDIVINMSNIRYVYDKDPKKHKDAKAMPKIRWKEFRKIVGDKWDPGLNAPFDPIASRVADENSITVVVVDKNIENFRNVIDDKEFVGSRIY